MTIPHAWVKHYLASGYRAIDPIIRHPEASILPADWEDLAQKHPAASRIFTDMQKFGIGTRGLSIPIRGPYGDVGLFSVTSDLPRTSWRDFKREAAPSLHLIGLVTHSRAMNDYDPDKRQSPLTPRETECLKWAASGKTVVEIGKILAIPDRTARFHLDAARQKLNCLNITHAVARAIRLHLIPLPF